MSVQDLIPEAIKMLQDYGNYYIHIINLLKASNWQEFYPLFLALSDHIDEQLPTRLILSNHQSTELVFLINDRLKRYDRWQMIDSKFILSMRYLKRIIKFNLQNEINLKRCNIFDMLQIFSFNVPSQKDGLKFREEFLLQNYNIFMNKQFNKQSYSYQIYEKLNEQQKEQYELKSTFYYLGQKQENKSDRQKLCEKYINSKNRKIIQFLLCRLHTDRIDKIRQQILSLQLQKKDDVWQLRGQLQISKQLLTQQLLIKCISNYKQNYRYFTKYFYLQIDNNIYFKYNLSKLLDINQQQIKQYIFNRYIHNQINSHQNIINQIKDIFNTSIFLIKRVISVSNVYYYRQRQLLQLDKQIAIFYSVKLMTFVFRCHYKKDGQDQPAIQVCEKGLKQFITVYLKWYVESNNMISKHALNNICELLRWIDEIWKYNSLLTTIFAQDKQDDLYRLFCKFLIKYNEDNADQQFLYHSGIWLIKFLSLRQNLFNLGDTTNKLYVKLYNFLKWNNKYYKLNDKQLDAYSYISKFKVLYYNLLNKFFEKNNTFIAVNLSNWIQELIYFQTSTNYHVYSRNHRLALLIIIFNSDTFPQLTEDYKLRMRNLILGYDFYFLRMKQNYRQIWDKLIKKIELDVYPSIKDCLQSLSKICENQLIFANNYNEIYFKNTIPRQLLQFENKFYLLLFLIKLLKQQLKQQQIMRMMDLNFRLAILIVRLEQRILTEFSNKSKQQIKYLNEISNNIFRDFKSHIIGELYEIDDYIKKNVKDIIIVNKIILNYGRRLQYYNQHYRNKLISYRILKLLITFIREVSNNTQCQFYPQFYNYHRDQIISLIYQYISYHQFKFDNQRNAQDKEILQTILEIKQQDKPLLESIELIHKDNLQKQITSLIGQLFSNQNWEYTLLINNIRYQKVNTLRIIERSIHHHFAQTIIKIFTADKIPFFHRIFKIISDCYHRRSREDMECPKKILNIPLSQNPIIIFSKVDQLKLFEKSYQNLIKKIFEFAHQSENQTLFVQLYQSLLSQLEEEAMSRVKKQLCKQLIDELAAILSTDNIDYIKYDKIHICINIVLQNYQDSIKQFLTHQFVARYVESVRFNLQNQKINAQNAKLYLILFQRLIPDSMPSLHTNFDKYAKTVCQICSRIIKYLKIEDIEGIIVSFLAKLIRLGDLRFSSLIVDLFKSLEDTKDTFSELLCEILQKPLRLASIQLQIKCYFLKILQLNKYDWTNVRIKLSKLSEIFGSKHKFHKDDFLRVVQNLSVLQQYNNEQYILLKNRQLDYSVYLNKRFIDYDYNQLFKIILNGYINGLNRDNNKRMKLKQLRIIAFNYPILVSYILMHPIQYQQNYIPLIDYIIHQLLTQKLNQQIYQFISYLLIDFTLIVSYQSRPIYFSDYLSYRIINRILEQEINNSQLVLIYSLMMIKRFTNLCFLRIKDNKSLYEFLLQKLKVCRIQLKYQNHTNLLLYAIISFLSRMKGLYNISSSCQYKKQSQWNSFNLLINYSWVPLHNLTLPPNANLQLRRQQYNLQYYKGMQIDVSRWYQTFNYQIKQQQKMIDKVFVQKQYLDHIGKISKTKGNDYFDITSIINTNFIENFRNAFQAINLYFLQHDHNQNNIKRRRRRMKDNNYRMFDRLQDSDDEQKSSKQQNNQQLQNQFNLDRQSRFAPQQFSRNRNNRSSQQNQDQDNQQIQKQLLLKLKKVLQNNNNIPQKTIVSKEEQITPQMLNILDKINETLTLMRRNTIKPQEIQGNNLTQKLQFLKTKELQTEFDYKESTMSYQQFENYCLANVSKLDRLGSERRNIVRNMQDTMLLKFVQRSISSDSVDYIIDTIDQNYQLLPNTLIHKNSIIRQQQIIIKKKEQKIKLNIKAENLSLQYFEDISQQYLYELLFNFYYSCKLFSIQYFNSFLENKKIQQKLINTLLYIYKNPFNNPYFPKNLYKYDLQNMKWQASDNIQQDEKQIRQNIIKALVNVNKISYYEQYNYLNRRIGVKGIKDIQYEPTYKSEPYQYTYLPINQVIEYALQFQLQRVTKDDENENQFSLFNILKGVSTLLQHQADKLIEILKQIHKKIYNNSQRESNIDSDDIYNRKKQQLDYNIQQNLKQLFKDQKIKQKIKLAFPIQSEDRQAFFIELFMNTGIYTRQQILKFHRNIFILDKLKSGNVYFANKAFKFYTQQQLKQCNWLKNSKVILPNIIKTLPLYRFKLKQQPFYKIIKYPSFLNMQFKSEILFRKVKEHKNQLRFNGSQEIVAQRKKGIFQSAFFDLRNKPDGFWFEDFSVKFMNQQGQVESGYGRGVAKDWYSYITKGMVNLNYGIFMKTSKNYYFFNRQSWINPRHLQFLQFIGKLFAISIINRQLYVAPSFSILVYKMILGEKIEISDIVKQFDEGEVITNIQKLRDYYDDSLFCQNFVYEDKRLISNKNLQKLRRKRSMQAMQANIKQNNLYLLQQAVEMKPQSSEQISKMSQQERIRFEEQPPKMLKVIKIGEQIELIPGGADIAVNMSNREEFISLTKQKIYDIIVNGVKQQFNAFMVGFKRIVRPQFISGLTAQQLRQIAEGSDKISIEDLKNNVTLGRGLDKNSQLLGWFWEFLQKLSSRDQLYLIQHWTGLPKISAQGFKGTNLNIVKGQYNGRLFAQTCFNKLHMPQFDCKEKMHEAITIAINSVKIGESIIED